MKTRSLLGFLLSSGFILGLSLTAYFGYPILEPDSAGRENRENPASSGRNVVTAENSAGGSYAGLSGGIDVDLYAVPRRRPPQPGTARLVTPEANGILISSL